jgi:hypothetical protein
VQIDEVAPESLVYPGSSLEHLSGKAGKKKKCSVMIRRNTRNWI